MSRLGLRRLLLILGPIAAIWAVVVELSGGFFLGLGSVRILSSREPGNPALIALLSALAAWALTPRATVSV